MQAAAKSRSLASMGLECMMRPFSQKPSVPVASLNNAVVSLLLWCDRYEEMRSLACEPTGSMRATAAVRATLSDGNAVISPRNEAGNGSRTNAGFDLYSGWFLSKDNCSTLRTSASSSGCGFGASFAMFRLLSKGNLQRIRNFLLQISVCVLGEIEAGWV